MWMYYEGAAGWSPSQSKVPTGNVVLHNDPSVRRIAERENDIVHWSEFDRGGPSPPWRSPTCSSATLGRSSASSMGLAEELLVAAHDGKGRCWCRFSVDLIYGMLTSG
jgi:hypothetical protein